MKLMDFFRGGDTGTSSPDPAPSTSDAAMNQQQTTSTGTPQNTGGEISDVDSFQDLWQTDDSNNNVDDSDLSSLFDVNPEKIQEAVTKINFTDSISQEALEAISAGGEDALKALSSTLNSVARDVFSKAMLANGVLVKQAFSKAQDKLDARTSKQFTKLRVSDELNSSNPLFKDPSVAPIVSAVREQLQRKYPDASPAEIRAQAEKYFNNLATKIKGPERVEDTGVDLSDFSNFG